MDFGKENIQVRKMKRSYKTVCFINFMQPCFILLSGRMISLGAGRES